MLIKLAVPVVTTLLCARCASAAPVVEATRAEARPTIDGRLDEACWQQAKPITTFFINNATTPAQYTTSASVLFDDAALYIGVRCDEPDVGSIKTEELPRDNGDVFRSDCIEIMLDPTLSRSEYFHLGINASGCVADRACTQGGHIGDMSWDAEVAAKSFIGDTFWSCEVEIPFYNLGITPKVKSTWGLNICREKKLPSENSSIAEKGAFNIAGSFPELRGVDVDFSRYCYTLGEPVTQMKVREGALDLAVEVPVENQTGKDAQAQLSCWLVSPTEKPHLKAGPVDLPNGCREACAAGTFTLTEQGEYECHTVVSDATTKKPLAYRKTALLIEYVPMAIHLVEPWYRDCLFETQNLKEVVFDVEVRLAPEKLKGARLAASIREAGKAKDLVTRPVAEPKETNRITLDATKLPYGRLQVVAQLVDADGKPFADTTHPLRKLPRKEGEVWLGPDMQWRVDGAPFFLNGAWNYEDGFVPDYNAFCGDMPGVKLLATRPMNDLHYKIGAQFREKSLREQDLEVCRSIARELRDKPNLFAYYMSDEPECQSWSASTLEQAYRAFRDEDPYHPVIISNDSMTGLKNYANCADINGLHPYPPIFRDKEMNDLEEVALYVEGSLEFFQGRKHKQTIAYLHQGFNYGDYGAVNQRQPSYREYRNQDLLALICGANGFIQFNRMVAHYPELYIGMPHLTKEFAYLGKVVLAPESRLTVAARGDHMKTLLKDVDGDLFLFACNASNEPRETSLTVAGLGKQAKQVAVVSEGRTVALEGDALRDSFGPWEVHIYTTSSDKPDLLTVDAICKLIDDANQARRKPGNLAFQMQEGGHVTVRASSNAAGQFRRADNALWHVVDGVIDTLDRYKCLTWMDTTPNESPDWLEIQLPKAHAIGRVVVYPFEKSLKDYAVQAFVDGEWRDVDKVEGQSGDSITHQFDPVTTDRIRLFITATNGENARVAEVEVYGK